MIVFLLRSNDLLGVVAGLPQGVIGNTFEEKGRHIATDAYHRGRPKNKR